MMFGLVSRAASIRRRSQKLLGLNLELAKVELKQKAVAFGIAGGLGVVALIFVVYAIGFLFAAAAVGLAHVVSLWLALLIVGLFLIGVAAASVLLAVRAVRRAGSPKADSADSEAQPTVAVVKDHV